MRKTLVPILVVGFVVAASLSAWAGPITITASTLDARFVASTVDNSNLGNEGAICSAFAQPANCLSGSTLLYKANTADTGATPASEAGSLLTSYDTLFSPAAGDYSGAVISYIGGSYASCPSCFLIVKDGNNSPAQYLFSLNAVGASPAWDGTSNITLSGFWVGTQGSISNVAVWGTGTSVPDGGMTLVLLGGALVGLGVLRRKFAA